jgi:NAD(P)-dependent dehydrogenase (short-subunit alcohol dehydrogenase family)
MNDRAMTELAPAQARTLAGKSAVVTGGGQGLGAAICRALSQQGATVFVADLRLERARGIVDELSNAGGKAQALALDVGDEKATAEALAGIAAQHGSLDAVINNAGIDFTLSAEELSIDQWDAVIRTNLRGPFLMAKHAAALMKKQGHGHIVNIASTAAKRAWPNASAYHASKWGLLGLSHALHAELRAYAVPPRPLPRPRPGRAAGSGERRRDGGVPPDHAGRDGDS